MGLFSSYNDRQVKKLKKTADLVEALAGKYSAMTDEELKAVTPMLKKRLEDGAKLDDLLPDAFAACREAATRVVHMRHYYVQLLGGICLHQGRIAEMATGEGKTLVATLPVYLNALSGEGVHVVTVNDYLARRDAEWMGKIYRFLGLTVGVVVPQQNNEIKRAAYACDVTYCTNSELGFDFLRDNMEIRKANKRQRKLNFAIVDEVDSILIDEARTPLIISGAGGKSTELYKKADAFARTLRVEDDYMIGEKEKTVMLTDEGIEKAQRYFRVEDLSDMENNELYHHILIALKANCIMKRDTDYIVSDGEVLIVDEFTGRIMIGRRYSDGLHQAIEAKEGVHVKSENSTVATITYQNFFRMYKKLSGMTGTAKTEEDEFHDIFNLDVVVLPTNKPSSRRDEHDKIYATRQYKLNAIVADIEDCASRGQPTLVGTVSVEKSEELSALLKAKGIRHNVLNAKNHKQEAEIIAQAGRKGAVTIATNMAGRGTDIVLGGNPEYLALHTLESKGYPQNEIDACTSFLPVTDEKELAAKAEYERLLTSYKEQTSGEKEEVIALGGLRIIGTERHESRRIDNQLRGRAGRQGDPGSSVFYISPEDEMMRIFGGERLSNILATINSSPDVAIESGLLSKQIEATQRRVESRNYSTRKNVLSYDDVMNVQRETIYAERGKVLDGMDVHEQIVKMIPPIAQDIVAKYADYSVDYHDWDYAAFNAALEKSLLAVGTALMTPELAECYDVYKLKDAVVTLATDEYEARVKRIKELGLDFGEVERVVLLKNVDSKWMDHLDAMDTLRQGIGLRGYGQRDPVLAFRQEGFEMFEDMNQRIQRDTVETLLHVFVTEAENADGTTAATISFGRPVRPKLKPLVKKDAKVGRNDPCPCGSGKKYKNCCGK